MPQMQIPSSSKSFCFASSTRLFDGFLDFPFCFRFTGGVFLTSCGNGTGRLRDDAFGLFSTDVILALGEIDDATKSGAVYYHHFQKFYWKNHPHQCLPILFFSIF